MNKTYAVDTSDGNELCGGLPAETARETAQRWADRLGQSVYLYEMGSDDESEEVEPSCYTMSKSAIVAEELSKLALSAIDVEESAEDSSMALDTAIPRPLAQRLCAALESRGVEASWAPDHDDRDLAWVHVTLD